MYKRQVQRIWVSLNFSNFIKSLPFSKNNLSAGTDRQCCDMPQMPAFSKIDVYKRQDRDLPGQPMHGSLIE